MPFFNFGWSPLTGVRVGHDKFIHAPRDELYDLAADPQEARNLIAERPEQALLLRTKLAHLDRGGSAPGLAAAIDVSQEERAKLAQLGYGASAATPAFSGPDPKDVIDVLAVRNRGVDRLSAGNVAGAIADLRAVLERCPGDAQARALLGQALMQEKAWPEARAELEHALRDRNSLFAAHAQLATCCLALGDPGAALHHLEVALAHDPDNLAIAREITLVHARRGDRASASVWLERCARLTADRRQLDELAAAVERALAR
ncbi:MAG: tetratricopeptide repeat protein [Planctomycetota bacterium]